MTERLLTYKRTGTDGIHGSNFEFDSTCLAYLRCKKLYEEFQRTGNSGVKSFVLANNVSEFCPLDDVVIKVEYFGVDTYTTQTKLIFVQCKHVAHPEKNKQQSFNKILGNVEVQKYFDTFLKIYKRFQSAQSQNESNAKRPRRDFYDFFSGKVTDCEFVMYTNLKEIPCMISRFELVTEAVKDNITKFLLCTNESNSFYRLKDIEIKNLTCGEEDKQLREIFCKNFIIILNQDFLDCRIIEEIKSILQYSRQEQHIHNCSKYFREEIYYHFNLPSKVIALSEESNVVNNVISYVSLKSQSEAQICQFKKNSSFENLFSVEAINKLEEKLSMPSEDPAYTCISTKFMELETRKIIQRFKFSGDMYIFLITSKNDERNWYLARETKTYSKWTMIKICSKISIKKPRSWKPNEQFVQISYTDEECDPISYFNTLSAKSQKILLSSEVCFQGKFQELGQCTTGKWKNLLDENLVCKMLEDKHVLNIGESLPNLDFYIERKFKIKTINTTNLPHNKDTFSTNCKFVLFSERNIVIPNTEQTIIWFENMTEARSFLQNIPEETDDDIHLCIQIDENYTKLSELIYTFGRKSKHEEIAVIEENNLLQQSERSKIVILTDIAGMGKTTTLLSIARKFKEENPSHWVFFLELNKYLNELRNGKFSDKLSAVNFVARKLLNLKSMELIFFIDSCIETGNVVLCFDAFDEISPDAEKIFPKLLKALEETKIKSIIVSSRPNFACYLEQKFYQNSIEFDPFKSKDNEKFLLEKWRTMIENENKEINANETDMEGAVNKILGGIRYESNSIEELLGIPLQMRMISEIYFDTFITLLERKLGEENLKINLYILYDKFITLHTIRYCTEKEGTMWEKLTEEKKILHLKEKLNDVEIFCTDFVCPKLKLPNMFHDVGLKLCNGIGLISSLKPPVFIHRTFAEFLAAKYIVSQIVGDNNEQNQEILQFFYLSILVEAKYETLRIFINATFGHGDFKERNIITADIKICRGIGGNTALHFAASEGNKEILEKLLVLNNYNINEINLRKQTPLLLACQKAKTSETAKYLINYPDCLVDAEDNDGYSALHYASRQGHTDIIQILLDREPSLLNKQNERGETPLHFASRAGKCDAVNELLTTIGCQVDAENNNGESALHIASEQGHTDITKILLDRDLSLLNKQNKYGETPLHLASYNGKCDAVKELLTTIGCQVDAEDNGGESALHIASEQGHTDIIKILLDRDLSLLNKQNKVGLTPLHLASFSGVCDAVKELLTTIGCQIDAENNFGESALHIASEQGHTDIIKILLDRDRSLLNKQNKYGVTPLHLASEKGYCDAVNELLTTFGCQVDAENNEGDSALHYASWQGHTDFIKILLDRDLTLLNKQNKVGDTPLHLASDSGKCDVVKELLTTFECQVDAENNDGNSALHYASRRGQTDIIKILLDRDRSLLNKQNKYGVTPLHLASYYGNCDAVKELLTTIGCQVDAEDNYGDSALHYASEWGNTDIIKILLDRDLTLLNKQNKAGDTSLHLASYKGNCDAVKELLTTFGCQVDAENNEGESALHYASRRGHTDIIKILLDRDLLLLNKQNKRGETPLHLASYRGKCDAVKELLTTIGCQVDAENNDVDSALHYASLWGHTDIIKILIDRDLSLLNKQNEYGVTPLHLASLNGKCDAVKEILTTIGCQVDAENNDGDSALHYASLRGHTDIIKILLDRDLSLLNKQDKDGVTPLHLASYYGKCDAVKEILTTIGCQVDAENNEGESALHYASLWGHTDIIKILLDRDLSLLNKQNKDGNTPLHLASRWKKYEAVNHLLSYSLCSVDLKNKEGKSALNIAQESGYTEIENLILERNP